MVPIVLGAGACGLTLQAFLHWLHLKCPKPDALSFIFPLSGSFVGVLVPQGGFVAGAEQHTDTYSRTGPRLTATGLATGFDFFAQRARFSFLVPSLGFCCALLKDGLAIGFAVCFPAEDLFCCFILSHFGTGDLDVCEEDVWFGTGVGWHWVEVEWVELGAAHMCSPMR